MKKILLITTFIGLLGITYAQKVKVYSAPGLIIKNNIVTPQGITIKANHKDKEYVLAYKKGYITQGEYAKNILKKEVEKYTFNLIEIPSVLTLDQENLNNIDFSRFKYKNESYYYSLSESEGKKIMENINGELAELGFKVNIAKQTLFEEKMDKVDFSIGAEVVSTLVRTLGTAGYNISTIVKWIVYDINKEKVVLNMTAFGYSNTKKSKSFSDEYKIALRDAMNQLIYDTEFQKIISSKVTRKEEKDIEEDLEINFNEKIPDSEEDILGYVKKATVTIKTEDGHGSGFFISSDGYILTNNHVIKNANTIEIELNSGLIIDAEVIRQDIEKDVALLKVIGKGFKSIPIFTGKANAGTEVYAVGTPADLMLGQTVTKGIISGKRLIEGNSYIQTDVSISGGNSGGPLVNVEGEVLGIVSAKLRGDGIDGIGFGIPILKALETLNVKYTN
ncbi:MAG: trypsin-like peptidase domain-containing protein [Flavobacteriales bacterium]|nr:trypsin-like peptidase domain-containing protein [Flavobacteriales bacterium]